MPETAEELALDIFRKAGAIKGPDVFMLSSGELSQYYVDKWSIFCDPILTGSICAMLANKIVDKFTGKGTNADIQIACGPADGGNVVASYTAGALMRLLKWNKILHLHTKKEGNGFKFMRGHEKKIEGKEVVVCEDMLSTGSSALKLAGVITEFGGKIVCVGSLWNRGGVRPEDIGGTEIISLINKEMPSWTPSEEELQEIKTGARRINTEWGYGRLMQ